MYQLGDNIRSH